MTTTRTGLSDLPLELLTLIVHHAASSTPPYAIHRALCRLSLVHSHFRAPAQSILFRSLRVGTQRQLENLVDLLGDDESGRRLGGFAETITIAEEGAQIETGALADIAGRCPKLAELVFRSVEVHVGALSDREWIGLTATSGECMLIDDPSQCSPK